MPSAPAGSSSTDGDGRSDGNTRLLIALGVLGAVSVMIAALVIFSGGGSSAPARDPVAQVRADGAALVVGRSDAPLRVVVEESYGSPASREFELASRDFLRIEAARGQLSVEYRPVPVQGDDFAGRALAAWGAVLVSGKPAQALAFHDVLFDQQPQRGQPTAELVALARRAGISDADVLDEVASPDPAFAQSVLSSVGPVDVADGPVVTLGRTPVTATSPTALADKLQRLVLEDGAGS